MTTVAELLEHGRRCAHSSGYLWIYAPWHSRANHNGCVLEHLLVVERAIGKPVPVGAEVHHFNENKADNRTSNLVLCPSRSYHLLLHTRAKARRATGNPTARTCRLCGAWDFVENLKIHRTAGSYHAKCHAEYQKRRARRIRALTPAEQA